MYQVVMVTFPRRKNSIQTITVSGKTRYPISGLLSKPWVGFYVHNQDASSSLYFDIDNEIDSTKNCVEVPPGEFRDFNLLVEQYICFYSTSSVECVLVTYVEPFGQTAIVQRANKEDSSQVYEQEGTPDYLRG